MKEEDFQFKIALTLSQLGIFTNILLLRPTDSYRSIFEYNEPDIDQYPATSKFNLTTDKEVFCSLCKESSKDDYATEKSGPIYGLFKDGDNNYFIHYFCALWTPNIFLNQDNQFENVVERD
jgi:hypothetical protein